jgi:hypothetical protein
MANEKPQDFSKWNGEPFFAGYPEQGRRAYLMKANTDGAFFAYGVVQSLQRVVFVVRGSNQAEQDRFTAQMKSEGAPVTPGSPPYDTQTGGDKPPPGGTPPGIGHSGMV